MYCPRCGTIATQNAAYCMQCGSQVSNVPSSAVDVETPTPEASTTNIASPPPSVTPAAQNTVSGLLLLFCIGQTILIPLSQIFINFDLISRIQEITPYIGQQWGPLVSGQAIARFDALASALTLLLTQSYAILCLISGLLLWRRKLSGIAFLQFAFLLNATVVALSLVLASNIFSNHEDHDVATIGLYLLAWLILGWQYFRYSNATQTLYHYDAVRFRQRRLLMIGAAGTALVLAGGLLSVKYAASSNRPDAYPMIIPVPPMSQNVSPPSPNPSGSEALPQSNSSERTGAALPSDLPPNVQAEGPNTSSESDRPQLVKRLEWGNVDFRYPGQVEKKYLLTNSSTKSSMGGDAFQVSEMSLGADGSTDYLLLGRGPCHDAECSSPLVIVTERSGRLITIFDGRASGSVFVSTQSEPASGYRYLADSVTGRSAQVRIIFPIPSGSEALPQPNSSEGTNVPFPRHQLSSVLVPNFATGDGMVKIRNGRLHRHDYSLDFDTDPASYTFGDFFGQSSPGIAATIVSNGGGSGIFYTLALFRGPNREAAYVREAEYVTSVSLGDRIKLNSIRFANGVFYVDLFTQGPDDGMCCPTLRKVMKYELKNSALVEIP